MPRPHPQIRRYGLAALAQGAALIRQGCIVAVPTETVYGLAADATNPKAVARIYAAKGRPSFNPLIVHVADLEAAEVLAVFDDDARALAAAFWPGPLTLVLPLKPDAGIAGLVTAGLDTIAIRVPRHRAMQALIAASGRPLAAPSANASGGISPTRAAHVATSLGTAVSLILDDGATQAGIESTIVWKRTVLRPGPITQEVLMNFAGAEQYLDNETPVASGTGPHQPVSSPGQLASHYAPAKQLRLDATQAQDGEWLIGFGDVPGDVSLSRQGDPVEAAARLFDLLHAADANPYPRIAIAPIPGSGIGAAIRDRLRRAAFRDDIAPSK